MNNREIYQFFIESGLTPEGACALMGNLQAESAMRANNAQDGMTRMSDDEYTRAADGGSIDFIYDSVGYGLAQWTYWARKSNLLHFAQNKGKSVGDTLTQLEYCVTELKREYRAVWNLLTCTHGIYEATAKVCTDYERPAINNINARYENALKFHAEFCGTEVDTNNTDKFEISNTDKSEVNSDTGSGTYMFKCTQISKGSEGNAVKFLQRLLIGYGYDLGKFGVDKNGVDGDFGNTTLSVVKKFQTKNKLKADGVVGAKTWSKLIGM